MLDIVFPRVYFTEGNEWKFLAVIAGKSVEYTITEYEAMGLAESILRASKQKQKPAALVEHEARCAV